FAASWFTGPASPFIPVLLAAALLQIGRPSRHILVILCFALGGFALARILVQAPASMLPAHQGVTLAAILLLGAAAALAVLGWLFQDKEVSPARDGGADDG